MCVCARARVLYLRCCLGELCGVLDGVDWVEEASRSSLDSRFWICSFCDATQSRFNKSLASLTDQIRSHSNANAPSPPPWPPWPLSPGASPGLDGGAWSPRPSGPCGGCSCCWTGPPSAQTSACCPEFALGHREGGHQGSAAPWWQAATMLLGSAPSPSRLGSCLKTYW